MSTCDMCGNERDLVDAIVEGSMLHVCRTCARHGKVVTVERPILTPSQPKRVVLEEISRYVMDTYASLVKQGREKKNWKQEDLAHHIKERESIIHKIESGHLKPSLELAEKLERALSIVLVITYEEPKEKKINLKDDALTIGDLIKLKDKRNV